MGIAKRTLQEAPGDPGRLRKILKEKQGEYEKATDSDDKERLATENKMLQFVVSGKRKYEKRRCT